MGNPILREQLEVDAVEAPRRKSNVHVDSSAPTDTTKLWIDTSTDPAIPKYYKDSAWRPAGSGGTGGGGTVIGTQATKLGIIASSGTPYKSQVLIPTITDFNAVVAVLKYIRSVTNQVTTVCAFNNADATSFDDNEYIQFDGVAALKTVYQEPMTLVGTLGAGKQHRKTVNKDLFKLVSKLEAIPSSGTGTKALMQDGSNIVTVLPPSPSTYGADLTQGKTYSGAPYSGYNLATIFDNNDTTLCYLAGLCTGNPANDAVTVDMGSAVSIRRLVMKPCTGYVKGIKVQTSNDGTNFTDVYSTDLSGTGAKQTFDITTGTGRYWRVLITSKYGDSAVSPGWYTIEMREEIPGSPGGRQVVGQAPATEAMFTTKGMTSSQLAALTASDLAANGSSFDLLVYDAPAVTYQSKLTALPIAQLLKAKGDMDLTSFEALKAITIYASTGGSGKLRVILSTDQGATWKAHNGTNVVTVDPTDLTAVTTAGMTPAIINALTPDQLVELVGTLDKIRFAYYFEQDTLTDIASVDLISITVDGRGKWVEALKGTDYSGYEFVTNSTLEVTFTANGDYKINIK